MHTITTLACGFVSSSHSYARRFMYARRVFSWYIEYIFSSPHTYRTHTCMHTPYANRHNTHTQTLSPWALCGKHNASIIIRHSGTFIRPLPDHLSLYVSFSSRSLSLALSLTHLLAPIECCWFCVLWSSLRLPSRSYPHSTIALTSFSLRRDCARAAAVCGSVRAAAAINANNKHKYARASEQNKHQNSGGKLCALCALLAERTGLAGSATAAAVLPCSVFRCSRTSACCVSLSIPFRLRSTRSRLFVLASAAAGALLCCVACVCNNNNIVIGYRVLLRTVLNVEMKRQAQCFLCILYNNCKPCSAIANALMKYTSFRYI